MRTFLKDSLPLDWPCRLPSKIDDARRPSGLLGSATFPFDAGFSQLKALQHRARASSFYSSPGIAAARFLCSVTPIRISMFSFGFVTCVAID